MTLYESPDTYIQTHAVYTRVQVDSRISRSVLFGENSVQNRRPAYKSNS